jgi:hypothetical protein
MDLQPVSKAVLPSSHINKEQIEKKAMGKKIEFCHQALGNI